jgi:hypothetical protein
MENEKPPILKSWRNLYLLVFIAHVLVIVMLYIFTNTFN